jgi:copper(I)-binding protein
MKKFNLGLAVVAVSLFSAVACAGDIHIEKATVRATAPGQETAMGDLHIVSKQAASLVGVTTSAAQSVELHLMTTDNGMMKMREVKSIALPAGKQVDLGESGYHLMLMGLKSPIKEGATVPLSLTVQLADKKTVKLDVEAQVTPLIAIREEMDDSEHMHMHHHH